MRGKCLDDGWILLLLVWWINYCKRKDETATNTNHASELACTDHYQGGGQKALLTKACFTQKFHMSGILQNIYLSYVFSSTLEGMPGLPSASGCLRPGLSADPFCFCNQQPCHSFRASLMASPPLPFHTSTVHDRSRPLIRRLWIGVCRRSMPGRGSHIYEINTWLWNFGRSQPRVGASQGGPIQVPCQHT